jgi:hypothetical protein
MARIRNNPPAVQVIEVCDGLATEPVEQRDATYISPRHNPYAFKINDQLPISMSVEIVYLL